MMTPPENTPFEEIVQEALEKVQAQLTSKNITVEVKSNLPVVNGDRIRLVEVVQNLVDNAAKYIGEQPDPKIEIGVRNTDGKRIFFVKDNGIGIDPQFHDKVFGLFDKLDPSSKGTGIGLALVKRIVEVHGGRIWVESEPRKGATFCFTLSQQASTER
jgi:signal transduction histidine kinase